MPESGVVVSSENYEFAVLRGAAAALDIGGGAVGLTKKALPFLRYAV